MGEREACHLKPVKKNSFYTFLAQPSLRPTTKSAFCKLPDTQILRACLVLLSSTMKLQVWPCSAAVVVRISLRTISIVTCRNPHRLQIIFEIDLRNNNFFLSGPCVSFFFNVTETVGCISNCIKCLWYSMAMFLQHCKCTLSVGVGTEKILTQQHQKTQ